MSLTSSEKSLRNWLSNSSFLPFYVPVIIQESFVKFLVTLFLKEQFFYDGSEIVKFWEVAHHNYNYPRVKAVDASHNANLIHPVCSADLCVKLKVVNSHIKPDQCFAVVRKVIVCWFLDGCACVYVWIVDRPILWWLAFNCHLPHEKVDLRKIERVNWDVINVVNVRVEQGVLVIKVDVVVDKHKLQLRVGFVKCCSLFFCRTNAAYALLIAYTWVQRHLQ